MATVPRPLSLAIGMFDGVHLGHQAVIESAVATARRQGGLAGVLTFWPHPSRVVRPENPTLLLMAPAQKERLLLAQGVDFVITLTFDRDLARIEGADFLPFLRQHLPTLRSIHIGENFRFGRDRSGDVASIIRVAEPLRLDVFSVDRVRHNGEPISSSRIRQDLTAGRIELVNTLLGHRYATEGPVVSGRQLGRQLGFPTLNLLWEPEVWPRFGVYTVEAADQAGHRAPAVANYGLRPTVDSHTARPLLEVHILGETTWTTGTYLTVSWLSFLRAEERFPSVDLLREQIRRDARRAAEFLGLPGGPT